MKKRSTSKDDQDIPEYKREQLGVGVRGKHCKQFMQGSNVVVLQPEITKATGVELFLKVDGKVEK